MSSTAELIRLRAKINVLFYFFIKKGRIIVKFMKHELELEVCANEYLYCSGFY